MNKITLLLFAISVVLMTGCNLIGGGEGAHTDGDDQNASAPAFDHNTTKPN